MTGKIEPHSDVSLFCTVHGDLGKATGVTYLNTAEKHRQELGCYYEIQVSVVPELPIVREMRKEREKLQQ